ncbi:hypothetical protein D3C81_1477660 [compost metagenome]
MDLQYRFSSACFKLSNVLKPRLLSDGKFRNDRGLNAFKQYRKLGTDLMAITRPGTQAEPVRCTRHQLRESFTQDNACSSVPMCIEDQDVVFTFLCNGCRSPCGRTQRPAVKILVIEGGDIKQGQADPDSVEIEVPQIGTCTFRLIGTENFKVCVTLGQYKFAIQCMPMSID